MATYDLKYPGAAIDAILDTAYHLQQAGYIFRGSASDYSGTPTEREWVIAPAGFTGLGLSSAVPKGSIGICLYNGTSWVGKIVNVVTIDSSVSDSSDNAVSSSAVYAAINQLATGVAEALDNLTFTDSTPSAFQDDYIYMKVSTTDGGVERILTYLTILSATTSKAGLMSAEDKAKVDSFLTGIRSMQFVDATTSSEQSIKLVEQLKWTVGGVQEVIDSITLLAATSSKAGLLSASDKAYIDALPAALTSLSNSISGALALMQSLVGYYVCDTAAGTAAKTVAATGYSLTNGGCIRIKMTNANTAANVTLNINSTGAKALYYDGTQASSTNTWEAGEVLEVYYDGTQYQCASGGGGKFATGQKVKDTSIANELDNSNSLPTCLAVNKKLTIEEEVSLGTAIAMMINNQLKWFADNNTYHYLVPCSSGDLFKITANSTNNAYIAWLTSDATPVSGAAAPMSSVDSLKHTITPGTSEYVTAPSDAHYLYIAKTNLTYDFTPASVKSFKSIASAIDDIADDITDLSDRMVEVENAAFVDSGEDVPITLTLTNNSYWDYTNNQPTVMSSNGFVRADYIDVTPYSVMKLQFFRNSNFSAKCFFANSEGTLVGDYLVNTSGGYIEYPVPEGATRLYLCHYTGGGQTAFNAVGSSSVTAAELAKNVDAKAEKNKADIAKLDSYTIGGAIEPVMENGSYINYSNGQKLSDPVTSCSDYIALGGAKYVRMTQPLLGSSTRGLAFYSDARQNTYLSGIAYSNYSESSLYDVVDIAVPEGAAYMRFTAYATGQARYFTPWYSLIYGANVLFKDAAAEQIATHIMRSCKSISQGVLSNNEVTNYAFSANMFVIGSYAYVIYTAGNMLNGDAPTPSAITETCITKMSIETNEAVETVHPNIVGYQDENGDTVTGNYKPFAFVPIKNGNEQVGMFGQIVIPNSKDPIVSSCGFGTPEALASQTWRMCKLQYTDSSNVSHDVRYSIANYRQMLVDKGFVSTYSAPIYDGFDNNCIIYDAVNNKYYDVICTVSSSNLSLPLIVLESTDTYTWTFKARIGTELWTANEIKGVINNGKIYLAIRTMSSVNALKWVVYDIASAAIVSQGTFISGAVVSRPYTFIFNNVIYMAINVTPTVYGVMANISLAVDDMRTEVNLYKIVNDTPVFMRKLSNPTGINYHCWEATPPHTISGQTSPVTAYGAIYCAFSEDRRLLFRRMFSQVSFGDVTPLFAENNRII